MYSIRLTHYIQYLLFNAFQLSSTDLRIWAKAVLNEVVENAGVRDRMGVFEVQRVAGTRHWRIRVSIVI